MVRFRCPCHVLLTWETWNGDNRVPSCHFCWTWEAWSGENPMQGFWTWEVWNGEDLMPLQHVLDLGGLAW